MSGGGETREERTDSRGLCIGEVCLLSPLAGLIGRLQESGGSGFDDITESLDRCI
jgi:hypothetical protein